MSAPIAEFTTLPPKSARMFAYYDSHGLPGLVSDEAISAKHVPVIVVPVGHGLIGEAMRAHDSLVAINAALAEQLERTTRELLIAVTREDEEPEIPVVGPLFIVDVARALARENERLIAEAKAVL